MFLVTLVLSNITLAKIECYVRHTTFQKTQSYGEHPDEQRIGIHERLWVTLNGLKIRQKDMIFRYSP